MTAPTLWQLFIAFGRANLLGYGGGPSVIPLVQAEVVDHFQWMGNEDFASALAVGNSLPGPIATKMAAFIGFKLAGTSGAIVALLATVLPTALLMTGLAALLLRYQGNPVVGGMIKGVKAVVFVLFVLLAVDFARFASPLTAGILPAVLAVISFVAIYFFNIHQAFAVLTAIIVGAIFIR